MANIAFIIYSVIKGKPTLKEYIKEAKARRVEAEEKERMEYEERIAKKKRQEEEFSSKLFIVIYMI